MKYLTNYLKSIVSVLFICLVIFVGWLYTIEPNYTVIRQIEIDVAPRYAYNFLLDLEKRKGWSPWENSFKDYDYFFSTPAKGLNASYGIKNSDKKNYMSVSITNAQPYKEIDILVSYFNHQPEKNIEWEFQRVGTKTLCVWEVNSKTTYLGRLSKQTQVETLAQLMEDKLKILSDSMETAYINEMPKIQEGYYNFTNVLSITQTVSIDKIANRDFVWPLIKKIQNYMDSMGYPQNGPPFTIFHGIYKNSQTVEVGVPARGNLKPQGEIVPTLMMGEVYFVELEGDYAYLDDARNYLEDYLIKNKIRVCCDPLEEYITLPSDNNPNQEIRTKIYIPK